MQFLSLKRMILDEIWSDSIIILIVVLKKTQKANIVHPNYQLI
jgi:hypothetical protein